MSNPMASTPRVELRDQAGAVPADGLESIPLGAETLEVGGGSFLEQRAPQFARQGGMSRCVRIGASLAALAVSLGLVATVVLFVSDKKSTPTPAPSPTPSPAPTPRVVPDWRGRSIYYMMTDKFAGQGEAQAPPCGSSKRCEGTLNGITERLDYILGMGFDAIWISPVVENVDENGLLSASDGYWAKNLYKIDPHLGSAADLRNLSDECHKRGMLLMVDIAPNHMGPLENGNLAQMVPFNTEESYHKLNKPGDMPFSEYMEHPCNAMGLACAAPGNFSCDGYNQTMKEMCWLPDLGEDAYLGDLDTENLYVARTLKEWVRGLVTNYSIDGLRLDSAPFMPQPFLEEFRAAADVYIFGEVATANLSFSASYQDVLGGVLNFPSYYYMSCAFNSPSACSQKSGDESQSSVPFMSLAKLWQGYKTAGFRDMDLLGNFVDNQDVPRFLRTLSDTVLLKSALTVVFFQRGIPIVYYGTEQGYNQEDGRTALWPHYNQSSPLYTYIKDLNRLRRKYVDKWQDTQQEVLWADEHIFVFRRSKVVVVVSNAGGPDWPLNPGRPMKVCLPEKQLPWGPDATAVNLLSPTQAAQPYKQGEEYCITLDDGLPAILAFDDASALAD